MKSGPARPEHVPKPWGHEIIWARNDRYVGKILYVRKGESLSYQYHRVKDETIRILAGLVELVVEPPGGPRQTVRLAPGDGWHIGPETRHRMTALEDSDVLEASSAELDDIVRLEDRYGRIP
jgi:mannose-6-phosphate isomerase